MLGSSGGVFSAPDLGILEFLRAVLSLVEMDLERRLRIEETRSCNTMFRENESEKAAYSRDYHDKH